jgi:NADPH:quinone reductase-like Zn-dependent oxidoreductase
MSGERMEIDSGDLIFRDKKVVGFWLSKVKFPPAEMTAMVGELVKLVATGAIKLPVAGVFGLDQAKEGAIASLGAGRNGKVLFRP